MLNLCAVNFWFSFCFNYLGQLYYELIYVSILGEAYFALKYFADFIRVVLVLKHLEQGGQTSTFQLIYVVKFYFKAEV